MLHGISASATPVSGEISCPDSAGSNVADAPATSHLTQIPGAAYPEMLTTPLSARGVSSLESIRQKKAEQCVHDLKQAFPMGNKDMPQTLSAHFWYSNDIALNIDRPNFQSMLKAMEEKTPSLSHAPRVAMLAGESFLLPILPELGKHCDVVMMTDYDLSLLQAQLKRIELMTHCESHLNEERFAAAIHNYIAHSFGGDKKSLRDDMSLLKDDLGDRWPFSSPERFAEVKEALSRLRFVPVGINLFCPESMEKLAKVLKDNEAEVHIINLTNIFDYPGEFKLNNVYKDTGSDLHTLKPGHLLRQLPAHPEALVHTSRIFRFPLGSTVTQPREHWDFLDRMMLQDVCNEYRLKGTFAQKVGIFIKQSSENDCYGTDLADLKLILACADASDMEDLMTHQDKLFAIIEQSGLLNYRKSEVKNLIEGAVSLYQDTQRGDRQ